MDELARIFIAFAVVITAFVVCLFVMVVGAFLGFTRSDSDPLEEVSPMATGTVTQIIWPNNNAPGEVQDHQTQELIPVPFSAVAARGLKPHLPFPVGAQIQYDILIKPTGKTATNVRPLE